MCVDVCETIAMRAEGFASCLATFSGPKVRRKHLLSLAAVTGQYFFKPIILIRDSNLTVSMDND